MSIYEHLNFNEIPRDREYIPALTIHSLNSYGLSTRISGIKSGRQHELLSKNEQNYFVIAEFGANVIDIREQFPMNIDKTQLIASELGLDHPYDQKKKEQICMTSDFCITICRENSTYDIIRTIKPVSDLMQLRTIEKYEIERIYWEREGINWGIVTELEINKILAKNIRTFRDAYSLKNVTELEALKKDELCSYKRELSRRLICEDTTTRTVIHGFSKKYFLPVGVCITLFNHLVATRVLRMDLRKDFNMSRTNVMTLDCDLMDRLLKAE